MNPPGRDDSRLAPLRTMRRRRVLTVLLVHGALGATGGLWCWATGRSAWTHPDPWVRWPSPIGLLLSFVLGGAMTVLLVVTSRALVLRTASGRALHLGFREVLGSLSDAEAFVFAGVSALAEEVFFRGALQPEVGWVLSSALFGLVHIGPDRRFLLWTGVAVAAGLVFGALHALTGHLVGSIVAHALVNLLNLHYIRSHDLGARQPRCPEAPSLVGARCRSNVR